MKTLLKQRVIMVQYYADNEKIEAAIVYMLINNVPKKQITIEYIESHLTYLFKMCGENIEPYVTSQTPYQDIPYVKKEAKSIAKKLLPDFYKEYSE
jgi:hypothetical protein